MVDLETMMLLSIFVSDNLEIILHPQIKLFTIRIIILSWTWNPSPETRLEERLIIASFLIVLK